MKALKKYFSIVMLVVFLVETTPDALWHAFTNHHDTVDTNSAATSISIAHTHCEALQSSLPSFSKSETMHVSANSIAVSSFYSHILPPTGCIKDVTTTGRAPPVLG